MKTGRRVVLLGVPSLYVLLGLLHPTANPELGDDTDLFVRLHVAQLVLIAGLGAVLWLLVDGVTNRAATVVRVLILPFVVAYTALDAIRDRLGHRGRDRERAPGRRPGGGGTSSSTS